MAGTKRPFAYITRSAPSRVCSGKIFAGKLS